ncbi:MAG: hypothetical protein WAR77_15620 [Saprospiraceae bacterium]
MDKVRIEPFMLIGISVRTTNEKNQATIDIVALWGKFMNEYVLNAIQTKLTTLCILFTQITKVIIYNNIGLQSGQSRYYYRWNDWQNV